MFHDTTIKRFTEKEGLQAVADLKARGFYELVPLTEIKKEGKIFTRDSYNRKVFQDHIHSSVWQAKMRREVEK